jgi:hypothetical protein
MVFFRYQYLASLQNEMEIVTNVFVIIVRAKRKQHASNKGLFLWLKLDRESWVHLISLSHKQGGNKA